MSRKLKGEIIMRSLYELLSLEKTCVDNIEKREWEMDHVAARIAELEANPFDCAAKTHEIEREHECLRKTTNVKEAFEKDLISIRAEIRDYLVVIMNKAEN